MTFTTTPPPRAESFDRVESLYEAGRCMDAWELGQRYGPLHEWPEVSGRLLAGRLARHLGAPRLGALLHVRCARAHPTHPDAQYFQIFRIADRRGALAALEARRRFGEPAADEAVTADYHGQCALLLASLRDFERAEHHLALARLPGASRRYWYAERSSIFAIEDRHEDALAAAREGLAVAPQYPPLVLSAIDALQRLGRHEEALELLQTSYADAQSSMIAIVLVRLLLRFRRFDEALAALARYEALSPLREREPHGWVLATRAEIATRTGDYGAAIAFIEQIDHPYHRRIAANLGAFLRDAGGRAPRRVELPVPFVQQHHMTCAPATLSAISRYWNRPAEHLAVAEEICYDGTPHHSERRWAESNGWRTAEFRVDWPSARALLDRGIPFTLTTSDVASGHLVAVSGYDEPTGVLLVRDPMVHEMAEMDAHGLFRLQASSGPRGMALVPREQSHLLDGLSLPDAALHDLFHELQAALGAHDRARAVACHARMLAHDPAHRLTLSARRSLAAYDANAHEMLAAIDGLLALYPDDQALLLARAESLRAVATRAERLAWLADVSTRSGSDALLWVEYATELMADARSLPEAHWQLRRALRRRPDDPAIIHQLAAVTGQLGERREAMELYRFAACLAPAREDHAFDYFAACRWHGETETGLAFLRRRWETLGGRAAGPAMTLFGALEMLDRVSEAFAVLERAVERRPEDGELRLFAASRCARYGRSAERDEHFAAARDRVKRSAWLAEGARQARLRGDRQGALASWREILALEPLHVEAHGAVALLLSEMTTREEALAHLRAAVERFPHHAALRQLQYQWSAGEPASEREAILRALIEIDPADAWTRRELALNLLVQGRLDDALSSADEALAVEASTPTGHAVKAHVLRALGRASEAADGYREALRRSADTSDAIHGLLDVAGETLADRTAALAFVQAELEAQPVFGDGVLAFRDAARGVLTPDELLDACRRMHARRPDLWHAWSALTSHLAEMGHSTEALVIARGAVERFTTVPRLWHDLAMVHRARLELDDEIAALERCVESSPEWITPTVSLADALLRAHQLPAVERLLERAIARTPLEPELRVRLAEVQHLAGDRDRALQTLRDTIRLVPEHDAAWPLLADWSRERGDGEGALEFARTFAASRPDETHAWLRLADLELRAGHAERALEALARVLERNPRHVGARDLQAATLTELRRFGAALAACEMSGERTPVPLQGRAAWVEWQRGDATGAIARMQRIVEGSPDYAWGWAQLVEWHAQQDDLEAATKAAARWEWLEPDNVIPLGWLGDLRRRMGDAAGARAAFERAMRLAPGYLYAGHQYFRLQTEEREYDGAARTLEILRTYVSPGQWIAWRAELEAARGDRDAAFASIRALCAMPELESAALVAAVESVGRTEWLPALEELMASVVSGGEFHEATPTLWMRVRQQRNLRPRVRHYRALAAMGEPGRIAVTDVLNTLGDWVRRDHGALATRVRVAWHAALIRLVGRAWREDPGFWGNMSFVLAVRGRHGAVIRWMRDWRERDAVEPWMLQNLSLAFLARGKDAQGLAVLRHVARTLSPAMPLGSTLALWCALGACLDDDLELAERLLADAPMDSVPESEQPLRHFAVTLLDLLRRPRTRASLTSRDEWALGDALERAGGEPATVRLLGLARLRMARHVRSPWLALVAWANLHSWVSTAVGIALTIGLLRIIAS